MAQFAYEKYTLINWICPLQMQSKVYLYAQRSKEESGKEKIIDFYRSTFVTLQLPLAPSLFPSFTLFLFQSQFFDISFVNRWNCLLPHQTDGSFCVCVCVKFILCCYQTAIVLLILTLAWLLWRNNAFIIQSFSHPINRYFDINKHNTTQTWISSMAIK